MEPKDYIITEISGEYATLTEKTSGETERKEETMRDLTKQAEKRCS